MDKAIKADDGKARYDLIPGGPLEDLAQVYTMGARKYADRNWEKGLSWSRVFAAIMRHLWAFWRGEDRDPESGLPHVIHAAWGCFALAEYMRTHREKDDRMIEMSLADRLSSALKASMRMPSPEISVEWVPAQGVPGQVYVPLQERLAQRYPSNHPGTTRP